jgi:hypothetical protein
MNLTNKQIKIVGMSVLSFPPETTAVVQVSEEIALGISRVLGTYNIKFDATYLSTEDPTLLSAIADKLALIPD